MGTNILAALINLYITTPGRRVYALRRVKERAEKRGLTALVKRIDKALAHEKHAAALEGRWGTIKARTRQMPSDLDPQIDRTLQLIEQMLTDCATDSDHEVASYTGDLLGALFPQTVAAHIQLPYIDQLAANERVLDELESKEREAWVNRLGLRFYIDRLRRLNDAFHQAMRDRDDRAPVTFAEVRAAREIGQRHYLQVTSKIAGQFCEDEDEEILNELMAPILEQNEKLRAYRRRRRRAVDINADTGEPLDDDDSPAPTAGDEPGGEPTGDSAQGDEPSGEPTGDSAQGAEPSGEAESPAE